ncbi:MAG: hypothetical protein JST00_09345 [Deltaproteobacteria bacterium]|nr:hypothetical protein [Deltaproteobacteria bacterium]
MKRRFGVAAFVGLLAVGIGAASPACKTATQVTVEIKTVGGLLCSDLKGVDIIIAGDPVDAEDRTDLGSLSASVPRGQCKDATTVGSLVVTPGSGRAAVVVVARVDENATCTPKSRYKGCIVSRRSFAFIEHAALALPIGLEIACKDVPCDAVTSCRTGACVSSSAECSESTGMCESDAEPVVLPDGGFVPPDGAVLPDGAPVDGPIVDGPIADAPKDVAPDSEGDADGAPGSGGNVCPRELGGPTECAGGDACCYQGSFFCGSPSGVCAAYARFACTGTKNCVGMYCCGTDPDASMPASACGVGCEHYLCNTDADCPEIFPRCTRRYYPPGGQPGGPLKECALF